MVDNLLLNYIPKKLFTVQNPDHPFTFMGPDLLISNSKSLLAVFTPNSDELKSPNRLFFRLINSRLVYPTHTQMVLLLNKNEDNKKLDIKFESNFNRIIEASDLKKVNLLLNRLANSNIEGELKYRQKNIFNIQAQMQINNLDYLNKNKFKHKEIKPFYSNEERIVYDDLILKKKQTVRSDIYNFNDTIIGFKNLKKDRSDLRELSPFYEFAIKTEFNIDNGIPYFEKINKKYLSLNEIPFSRFDPLKPIRIASLFGWFIGNINHPKEIINLQYKRRD